MSPDNLPPTTTAKCPSTTHWLAGPSRFPAHAQEHEHPFAGTGAAARAQRSSAEHCPRSLQPSRLGPPRLPAHTDSAYAHCRPAHMGGGRQVPDLHLPAARGRACPKRISAQGRPRGTTTRTGCSHTAPPHHTQTCAPSSVLAPAGWQAHRQRPSACLNPAPQAGPPVLTRTAGACAADQHPQLTAAPGVPTSWHCPRHTRQHATEPGVPALL